MKIIDESADQTSLFHRTDAAILHVGKFYPPHPGGMENHVRDLAVRQTSWAQVNVIVASTTRQTTSEITEGVQLTRLAQLTTVASMPICPRLPMAIRKSPADLVHVHMPNPAAALAYLLSGHKGKLIVTHHADTMGRVLLRKLSDPFVNELMRRAHRIIVTSNRYLDSSLELKPFRDKCTVVPLGINLPALVHPGNSAVTQLKEQFGSRIVISVGRLVPYKGFDVLVRAMKSVEAHLLLIGTGPLQRELIDLARAQGVEKKISFLGKVNDLSPFLAATSLFVLPSVTRAEAFGLVQLEAMAAGVPVVNTFIDSGVPDVSIHGHTGFTVSPHDVNELANAMSELLDRDDLRRDYGENARMRVQTEFTADLMSSRTLAIYERVLGSI